MVEGALALADVGPLLPANPPPLKLSRLTIESLRLPIIDVDPLAGGLVPAAETPVSFPPVPGGADFEVDAGNDDVPPTVDGVAVTVEFVLPSPGTTPAPDRRAMSALTALSHLISSSSEGAQSNRVFLGVITLNVWVWARPPSGLSPILVFWTWGADVGGELTRELGVCLCAGKSYSRASRICDRGIWRCGLVS